LVEGKRLFYAEYPGDGGIKNVNPGFTFRAVVIYNDSLAGAGVIVRPDGSPLSFRDNNYYRIDLYNITAQSFDMSTIAGSGTHYVYIYSQ